MTQFLSALLFISLSSSLAFSEAKIGQPAPAFEVMDANGKVQKLSDHKGKTVVLEWYNKDCPYVVKHYSVGNMQKIQKETTAKGIVWLTVISSAKGKQGYLDSKAALANAQANGAAPTAILIDDLGKMGRSYDAKTTPHMYLIDDKGILRYNGAIDSNSSANSATIEKADNYILAATNSLLKGEKIAKETTKPYGCSVKY